MPFSVAVSSVGELPKAQADEITNMVLGRGDPRTRL